MATTPDVSRANDPLLAPPKGFEPPPLVSSEMPPLVPPLLTVSPTSRRLENLDAMRVLCIFAIIITHVTEPYLDATFRRFIGSGSPAQINTPLYILMLAVNVCGRFGVPCFLMISFYIYWHQLYEKGRSWGELLHRRIRRLIPPFLAWSLIYFAIHKVLFKYTGRTWETSLHEFRLRDWHTWYDVLVLGRAEYHLYYLPLLVQCLLFIPVLQLLWKKPAIAWTCCIASAALWAIGLYGIFFPQGTVGAKIYGVAWRFLNQPWAFPFLVFPLLGMIFAGQKAFREFVARSSTRFWVGLLICSFAMHLSESLLITHLRPGEPTDLVFRANVMVKVGRILSGIAVFALFIRHPLMRNPFPKLANCAFGLHFMHPAIILMLSLIEVKLFGTAASGWQRMAVPMLVANTLLTCGITAAICVYFARFKRLQFLVV